MAGSRLSEKQGVTQVLSDHEVEPDFQLCSRPLIKGNQSADGSADYFLLAH